MTAAAATTGRSLLSSGRTSRSYSAHTPHTVARDDYRSIYLSILLYIYLSPGAKAADMLSGTSTCSACMIRRGNRPSRDTCGKGATCA
eukprot:scaffold41883_cov59-Phaeocystis_antarctica.AAC.1